jgi:hypothetical protein
MRLGEGGVDLGLVADGVDVADVARAIVPDLDGLGLDRERGIDQGGQGVVVDLDALGRVRGGLERLGDDEGDADWRVPSGQTISLVPPLSVTPVAVNVRLVPMTGIAFDGVTVPPDSVPLSV